METSPLIWRASQWTDFYMIGTSIIKELRKALLLFKNVQRYLLLNSNSLEKKKASFSRMHTCSLETLAYLIKAFFKVT